MAASRYETPRSAGPHTYRLTPASRDAIITGDFNMRPGDPALARLSEPYEGDVPRLVDIWRCLKGDAPHPASANLFDQNYGEPGCLDYVLATPDLGSRARSIFYDLETQVSDHQPILVEFDES